MPARYRDAFLWVCYSFASMILGIYIGLALFIWIHSTPADIWRVAIVALGSLALIVITWVAAPRHRPSPASLLIVVFMWSSLFLGASLAQVSFAGRATSWEISVLVLSAAIFFFGVWLSRYSRWSKEFLYWGWTPRIKTRR